MRLPNCPTHVSQDAHEAILRRGYCWEACRCAEGWVRIGRVLRIGCADCGGYRDRPGDGGRYVLERMSADIRQPDFSATTT